MEFTSEASPPGRTAECSAAQVPADDPSPIEAQEMEIFKQALLKLNILGDEG
jgi:hypothetical protein